SLAQLEADTLAAVQELPLAGQLRLGLQRDAIDPHQHSAGQIANCLRGLIFHQERVECLGLRAQAKAQLSPALGQCRYGAQQQRRRKQAQAVHLRTSSLFTTTPNKLITAISTASGSKRQGSGRNVTASCSSRSRLPSDGSGSDTPRPSAPRLASAIIKTGIEIQN